MDTHITITYNNLSVSLQKDYIRVSSLISSELEQSCVDIFTLKQNPFVSEQTLQYCVDYMNIVKGSDFPNPDVLKHIKTPFKASLNYQDERREQINDFCEKVAQNEEVLKNTILTADYLGMDKLTTLLCARFAYGYRN
jgi:hypothetical protein